MNHIAANNIPPGVTPAGTSESFEELIGHALDQVSHFTNHAYDTPPRGRKRALDASLLAAAARRRGLDVTSLTNTMQIFAKRDALQGFFQNMSWDLTTLDRLVTHDKELTKSVLRYNELPVAQGTIVTEPAEALAIFRQLQCPVVVKPITGSSGKGIAVDVRNEHDLLIALDDALQRSGRVLVEECVPSIDVRVMTVARAVVAAMLRVPAHITGDGQSTISQLIERKNDVRAQNPYLRHSPISLDPAIRRRLKARGLTDQTVLSSGYRLFLHFKANLGAGGDSYNITDHLHPTIAEIAVRAAECFPSAHHTGIDLLVQRFDQPADAQRVVICEVNCNNDLPMHVFPLYGPPVDTSDEVIRAYSGRLHRVKRKRRSYRNLTVPDDVALAVTKLTEPIHYGECEIRSSNPRFVDRSPISKVMAELGRGSVHFRGPLLFISDESREYVLERSGQTVFASRLAERPEALERMLRSRSIPVAVARQFHRNQRTQALEFLRNNAGPWHAFAFRRTGHEAAAYWISGPGGLERVWPRLSRISKYIVVQQAAQGLSLSTLLVQGEPVAAQVITPFSVVGNGDDVVADLVRKKEEDRGRHPYLRHLPVRPAGLSHKRLNDRGVDLRRIPAVGELVGVDRPAHIAAGADTVGLQHAPSGDLAEAALDVWRLAGRPTLLEVTFACRDRGSEREKDEQRDAVVMAINPDPILAQFAYPWAGQRSDPYRFLLTALSQMPYRVLR